MPADRRPFVLLDRDGTLVEDAHYLSDPGSLRLLPGAARALTTLAGAGLGLALVTNQSGVGRGYFDLAAVGRVHARLRELLRAEGVALDGVYVCPHGPGEGCRCRKPAPGLAERAARELGFDLRRAFVVGDRACDVELGRAVGATSVLVRTGARADADLVSRADAACDDLAGAAAWILARAR